MMNIDFITATVLDGAFAAVAAIGFAIYRIHHEKPY